MKKLAVFFMLMIIMALCVALVSCDDETENDSQGGNSTSSVDSTTDSTTVDSTADDGSFGADFSKLIPPNFEFPDMEA